MKLTSILRSKNWTAMNMNLLRHMDANAALLLTWLCDQYEYYLKNEELAKEGAFFCTAKRVEEQLFFKRSVQDSSFKVLADLGILTTIIIGSPPKRHVVFFENAPQIIADLIASICIKSTNQFAENQQINLLKINKSKCLKSTNQFVENKPTIYVDQNYVDYNEKDNSEELSLSEKNEKNEFSYSEQPEELFGSTQSEKEKSSAKKEKATAITKEFKERGLYLFALAKSQPTDDWYYANRKLFGEHDFWAVFKKMHEWCVRKTPYEAPAKAFPNWAINYNGLQAFHALQAHWHSKNGGGYCLNLAELPKSDKPALEIIGTKLIKSMEEKGEIVPLQDMARIFFDKMPERWCGEWFNLQKISKDASVILAEIANPTVRTNPYSRGGAIVTPELLSKVADGLRRKDAEKAAQEQAMRELGLIP